MIIRKTVFALALLAGTAGALAHKGVQNADVMARMNSMSAIKEAMKLLDDMAKGNRGFDQDAARKAAGAVAMEAAKTADLFKSAAKDPKSEALPVIWDSFDDFTAKAGMMEEAASKAASGITDSDSLRASLIAMGKTCKSCHSDYRKKK